MPGQPNPSPPRVLGPQQLETKIDQDRHLSGQLTLWDQRGSNVIRGNVLAIPIGDTLLYVERIYLEAETAAHPELRLVALLHEDSSSYAPTFDEALDKLLAKGSRAVTSASTGGGRGAAAFARCAALAHERNASGTRRRIAGIGIRG